MQGGGVGVPGWDWDGGRGGLGGDFEDLFVVARGGGGFCRGRGVGILGEFALVDARLFDGREEHEVFLSDDLHVDVLVVVAVKGCYGAFVS